LKINVVKGENNMFQINNCSCGREHIANIEVISECGAMKRVPEILKNYKSPFVIADVNTYNRYFDDYKSYIFKDIELVPDESTLGCGMVAIPDNCDILIAVGAGTINDISRYLSYRLNIPYIIVATAPSMDGYASSVAPLIVDNMKITYNAHYPKYIIADIDIIKNAPHEMIIAGVGDILGKYTCLCDWELSHVVNGEYYCENIAGVVRESIHKCVDNIDGLIKREEDAVKNVIDALILSGIAMSYAGNSRPASGSEHHLSHFWEMNFLFNHKKAILHGIKVGLATPIIAELYSRIRDIDIKTSEMQYFDYTKWVNNIENIFGSAAEGIINLGNKCGKNSNESIKHRYEAYKNNWVKIIEIMKKVPDKEVILNLLKTLKAPNSLRTIGVDEKTFYNSLIGSKDLRDRFTILELVNDLCLSEKFANELYY
jgi:glycerol-1-phosphate dehydrogenase [NAD(P)+]